MSLIKIVLRSSSYFNMFLMVYKNRLSTLRVERSACLPLPLRDEIMSPFRPSLHRIQVSACLIQMQK